MNSLKKRTKAGFTLMEIVVVLAIIAILSAIFVPSVMGYVEYGRQQNRDNIARTVYLAAQNQLTEMRITKNLEKFSTSNDGFVKDKGITFSDSAINEDNVVYISKPRGLVDSSNPVMKLLDPIILDKSILSDAILIEYNIKTGIVLSAFYGDTVPNGTGFDYSDANERSNIIGSRGYEFAAERRQGYYGVGETGKLSDPLPSSINVYDSLTTKLPDDNFHNYKNVLYAVINIPRSQLNGDFTLLINDIAVNSTVLSGITINGFNPIAPPSGGGDWIYRYDGDINGTETDPNKMYARFIWVLDYVGGNMTNEGANSNTDHSIGVKYNGKPDITNSVKKLTFDSKTNLRVGIKGTVNLTSFTQAHPYFYSEHQAGYTQNQYKVASARHLYNLRYKLDGNFTQILAIDLNDEHNFGVSNFSPIINKDEVGNILPFIGTYNGKNNVIKELTIDLTSNNVGLFGEINGELDIGGKYKSASVFGLALENPMVLGKENVGSVCGLLKGYMTGVYVRYNKAATTTPKYVIGGERNVGGIVGYNGGMLTDSAFISPTTTLHIEGKTSDKSTIGGIVGEQHSVAKLSRVLFLALSPGDNTAIHPIIGTGLGFDNANNKNKLYYLSGSINENTRPKSSNFGTTPPTVDYNTKPANLGEGFGTQEFYEFNIADTGTANPLSKDWIKNTLLSPEKSLDRDNDIYPYPFTTAINSQIAKHPDWPIVEGGKQIGSFTYYEHYSNNTFGYASVRTLVGNTSPLFVTNDGYAVEFSYFRGTYELKLNDKLYEITGGADESSDWTVPDGWSQPRPFTTLDGYDMYRLIIPNSVFDGVEQPVTFDLRKQVALTSLSATTINTLLAPAANGYIRSPRHIDNIDQSSLTENYTQQLNIDFDNYYTELNTDYSVDTDTKLTFEKSVVIGGFTGSYNGNGRTINNLSISEATTDNLALFEKISDTATVKNIIMRTTRITGKDYIGAIASITGVGTTITNCQLVDTKITGINYVGGIVGDHAGDITQSFIGTTSTGNSLKNSVDGKSYVGGIAGKSTGNINISYVDYTLVGETSKTTAVTSTLTATYVGGIAGYMDGGLIKNVYFNYGDGSPQVSTYTPSVIGKPESTAGLIGYMKSGNLASAYTTAYFNGSSGNNSEANANYCIGTKETATAIVSNTVYYLRAVDDKSAVIYNKNAITSGYGLPLAVSGAFNAANNVVSNGLRGAEVIASLGTNWTRGSYGAIQNPDNPTTYTYPRLKALQEPTKWPLPDGIVYRLKYYERYANGEYKLYGGSNEDDLYYDQSTNANHKIIEDGYVIEILDKDNNGTCKLSIYDLDNSILLNAQNYSGKDVMTLTILSNAANTKYVILDLEKLHSYSRGLAPIRVTLGKGSITYTTTYFNPLFAKALFNALPYNDADSYKDYEYLIRTPRHLSNIGSIYGVGKPTYVSPLIGRFNQETDVDFYDLNKNGTGYHMNKTVHSQSVDLMDIDTSLSVVKGSFSGIYNAKSSYDNSIKAIKGLTLPSSLTTSTPPPQAGNIGIFSTIGNGGSVQNIILSNNSVSGTTGNVGGLSGINYGNIENVQLANCTTTATTGKAGGVAGQNSGVIKNVVYVSSSQTSPVSSNNNANAGGITTLNNGSVLNTLYLAIAPYNNPIATSNEGTGSVDQTVYYLSGTHSSYNRPESSVPVTAFPYNYNGVTIGKPLTTQELYDLNINNWSTSNERLWTRSSTISNVLGNVYPYQYLGRAPSNWPVATVVADNVAYYEKYNDNSYGYYSPKSDTILPSLKDNEDIVDSGYIVIMPDGFSTDRKIKINSRNGVSIEKIDNKNVAKITNVNSTTPSPTLITVNDFSTGLYINTLFAKGVYNNTPPPSKFAIRTPQQMINIAKLTDTTGITFIQECDLDFTDLDLNKDGAVVKGEFKGIFDGGVKTIQAVTITAPSLDNVGLFSQNSGEIKNVTLKGSDTNPTSISGNDNVGGIVGYNLADGVIDNCKVIRDSDGAGVIIEGTGNNVDDIVGKDDSSTTNPSVQLKAYTNKATDKVSDNNSKSQSSSKEVIANEIKPEVSSKPEVDSKSDDLSSSEVQQNFDISKPQLDNDSQNSDTDKTAKLPEIQFKSSIIFGLPVCLAGRRRVARGVKGSKEDGGSDGDEKN